MIVRKLVYLAAFALVSCAPRNYKACVISPVASGCTRPLPKEAAEGIAEYVGADGQRRVGALADVHGTPWAAWVEFPDSVVFAPARTFLSRMLVPPSLWYVRGRHSAQALPCHTCGPG